MATAPLSAEAEVAPADVLVPSEVEGPEEADVGREVAEELAPEEADEAPELALQTIVRTGALRERGGAWTYEDEPELAAELAADDPLEAAEDAPPAEAEASCPTQALSSESWMLTGSEYAVAPVASTALIVMLVPEARLTCQVTCPCGPCAVGKVTRLGEACEIGKRRPCQKGKAGNMVGRRWKTHGIATPDNAQEDIAFGRAGEGEEGGLVREKMTKVSWSRRLWSSNASTDLALDERGRGLVA